MPTDPGPLRAGNRARSGECGIVRVRPQPPQLSVGRRIGCRVRVRLRRVGNGGGQGGPRLAPVCGRQDRLRFRGSCWGDRRRGRSGMGHLCLNGGGCGIRFRARDNIGAPGFHFDAAVTSTTTGVQFLIRMDNKQKEAETKENDHSRCRDKAERDEGERGCDIGLRCPDPLSRGIGERNRCFGGSWTRVLGTLRGMSCRISSLNNCFPRIRRCTSRSPPGYKRRMTTGRRPLSLSKAVLPVSVLAGGLRA
jgi:hypothetical protein